MRRFILPQLVVVFCATLAQAQSPIEHVHLLDTNSGWAMSPRAVYLTINAGRDWRDVTPRLQSHEGIASAYFVDASHGFVFIAGEHSTDEDVTFRLARTSDGGVTWSSSQLHIPHFVPAQFLLSGSGSVFFLDARRGWLNLDVVSSANFRLAILLETRDGGDTWTWAQNTPGISGTVYFVTPTTGFISGGPDNHDVYVTRDGALHWTRLTFLPPSGTASDQVAFDTPKFVDKAHGTVVASYTDQLGSKTIAVLYTTSDGGLTWNAQVSEPADRVFLGTPVPATSVASHLLRATFPKPGVLRFTRKSSFARSTVENAIEVTPGEQNEAKQMEFSSTSTGWILLSSGKLLSTLNGGGSWTVVTPGKDTTASQAISVRPLPASSVSQTPVPPESIQTFIGDAATAIVQASAVGFHACSTPNATGMAAWWAHSPFSSVGVYIGGSSLSSACTSSVPTSTWVSTVKTQGWAIAPFWVGPQAPCACAPGSTTCTAFPHTFTAANAASVAVAHADNAVIKAGNLGLPEILYYDMENYSSSSCGGTVQTFLKSWVTELHARGFKAGVYGTAADAQADFSKTGVDDVWVAKWPNPGIAPNVSVWNLAPLCDPYSNNSSTTSATCNTLWVPNKRTHQFLSNVSVSFGGLTVRVDPDVGAAPMSSAPKAKPASLAFTPFACSNASHTDPAAISNMGTIVGSMIVSNATKAFIYKGAQPCAALSYTGASDTEATGVNDKGQVIGVYFTDTRHGFFYDSNAATTWTTLDYPGAVAGSTHPAGINDAGLVVGFYGDSAGNKRGFLYDNITHKYKAIDVPGMDETFPDGINGLGQIVGETDTFSAFYQFLYNNGKYTTTSASALQGCFNTTNNSLMIVGSTGQYGCLYQFQSHLQKNLMFSGATETVFTGISDFGISGSTWSNIKIIGNWHDDKGGGGAFIASFQ